MDSRKKSELNSPYGGTLVSRLVSMKEVEHASLPQIEVNSVIETDAINIATGIYSPLTGFMDQSTMISVLKKNSLVSPMLPWTIPIFFDVNEAEAQKIKTQKKVLLISQDRKIPIGFIEVSEVFKHDKSSHVQLAFGSEDRKHPGVKRVLDCGDWLVAGKVTAFQEALSGDPLFYPRTVRQELEKMGIARIAGFQTRNVVHRAHEYLQRIALEVCDGLLVHPIVGWKKAGDFKAEVVKKAYRYFINAYFPKNKVLLAFLNAPMRYAGPKEAVLHAIIRKNFGCSHFIVGRDHAGVGGFYDMYAAHRIFDEIPDLGISILRLKGPFYCRKCEMIATENTCGHPESDRESISGTQIRDLLSGGSQVQNHVFRPDVLESLKEFREEGFFYE